MFPKQHKVPLEGPCLGYEVFAQLGRKGGLGFEVFLFFLASSGGEGVQRRWGSGGGKPPPSEGSKHSDRGSMDYYSLLKDIRIKDIPY